jgi:hypothetical protein
MYHLGWLLSKQQNITNVDEDVELGKYVVQPRWETIWRFLKKLEMDHVI